MLLCAYMRVLMLLHCAVFACWCSCGDVRVLLLPYTSRCAAATVLMLRYMCRCYYVCSCYDTCVLLLLYVRVLMLLTCAAARRLQTVCDYMCAAATIYTRTHLCGGTALADCVPRAPRAAGAGVAAAAQAARAAGRKANCGKTGADGVPPVPRRQGRSPPPPTRHSHRGLLTLAHTHPLSRSLALSLSRPPSLSLCAAPRPRSMSDIQDTASRTYDTAPRTRSMWSI